MPSSQVGVSTPGDALEEIPISAGDLRSCSGLQLFLLLLNRKSSPIILPTTHPSLTWLLSESLDTKSLEVQKCTEGGEAEAGSFVHWA